MQVELDESVATVIREKIETGDYRDANDVIEAAIALMAAGDQRRDRLRAEVAIGLAQIERGELIEFTPELLVQLSREAEENARLGKPAGAVRAFVSKVDNSDVNS